MLGERVNFANTLRGIAALVVVVSHYFDVFWSNRVAVSNLTGAPVLPIDQFAVPFYVDALKLIPVINFGSFGVALFFLVSGFVIPFSLGKISPLRFLTGRFFRIYPTYAAGFTVTCIFLLISSLFFSTVFGPKLEEVLLHYIPGVRDIFGGRSIDGVIWTLEIEVKFYLFVAVFYSLVGGRVVFFLWAPFLIFVFDLLGIKYYAAIATFSPSLAVAVGALVFCGQFMIYMFLGVVLNFMYRNKITPQGCFVFVSIYVLMFLYQWQSGPLAEDFSPAWSYGLAFLFFVIAYANNGFFSGNRFFSFFADISYPLYVVHGVTGYVALRILLDLGVKAWVSLLVVSSGVVVIAWAIHLFVEVPSQHFGRKCQKYTFRSSVSADIRPSR